MDDEMKDFHAFLGKAQLLATALDALLVTLAAQNQAAPSPATKQALHLAERARSLMAEMFPETASDARNTHPDTTQH